MLEFAKTPPKGWNSWDVYGASVTEEEVKRNADIMAEKLKKYGWNYVVVDIQWYEPGAESAAYRKFADLKIDEYSRVLPAENRFPSSADGVGFAPLAEYVHQLGLKFGIHILRGIPRQAVHRTLKGQRQEYRDDEWIVWSGENKESTYIAIFNVSDEKKEIPGKLTERYLRKDAKEIWSGKKVTEGTEGTEEVESHGCVLYQMKRI